MPDIHDLLETGAGEPPAPLDLDRALRRGAERARNRRVLQAAVGTGAVVGAVAVALTLAGGGGLRTQDRLPGTTLLPDDSVPEPAGSADPRLQPIPAADPSMLPDGTNFVLVREVRADRSVVVDKVTRALSVTKQAKCAQVGLGGYTPTEVFGFCWSNQNAKLRVVPVADSVTTVQINGPLSWEGFRSLIARGASVTRSTVLQVEVRDNVILAVSLASNA